MKNIAILGAQSALGAEVLAQALLSNSYGKVFVLDELCDSALEQDVRTYLASRGVDESRAPAWQRLQPSQHMLGMTQFERERLLDTPLAVFVAPHRPVAGLSAERIRCVATSGLRHLAGLLKGCDAQINYVSSHLVAGDRMGAFTEFDTDCGQHPRNAHEYAAQAGEAEARALFANERLNVFRLPFLSGAADDGHILEPDGLLSTIAQSLMRKNGKIYANPAAMVPVASVDHVARHVLAIALSPECNGTYHLSGCGLRVEDLCRLLTVPHPEYRSLAAYRLHALIGLAGDKTSAKSSAATAVAQAVDYLYPQVHHDAYRYGRAVADLGLTPIPEATAVTIDSTRDLARQTRYDAALRAYADIGTVGMLDHDPNWHGSTVIDDIAVPYLDTGHGTPIVFLSGALGPEYWLGTMRYLESRFRCILVGTVGWSGTLPNSGSYAGHEDQAALLKGLLAHLGIRDACHFVAADVAAPIMQYFASRWPEKIASLQLVNPVTTPHEIARCLPLSLRSRLADDKGIGKLVVELQKSEAALRKASAFDQLITKRDRASPERWQRMRNNIAADKGRLDLFCAALRERLSTNDLPRITSMKCTTHVLWFCENNIADLALYAQRPADVASNSHIVLVADVGMDAAEAQPILIGDLIVERIHSLSAPPAAAQIEVSGATREAFPHNLSAVSSRNASMTEPLREAVHG